ncbi:hypothetical protein [Micromonospora sp. NBC_01813]|uniref:hypothetical protein n=1 Tax=Micromonospora sp. NBC_01813 TaxID=2975988 RepID=UPI002DD88DDD|nr:hypothetical protein [Micromonospora sp. NBC_01813]WSA06981.1 hypothetical protein OG958_22310 [Micromonospora sp. NBC_01813]
MKAHDLIAALVQLGEQNPEALDSTVEFACPEIEDPWEIGTVRHWRNRITLGPVAADEDDHQASDLPDA